MGKSIFKKTKIGIIGAGRVGTSLAVSFDKRKTALAFYSNHYSGEISGVKALNFEEFVKFADIIIIAVKDSKIASTVERLKRAKLQDKIIFHLSGFHSSEILKPIGNDNVIGSFHPILPFTEKYSNIKSKKFYADIEGDSLFVKKVRAIFKDFKRLTMFEVNPDDKPILHLSLTLISNYPLYIVGAGKEILGQVVCKTLMREISGSLLRHSFENYINFGNISGPLERKENELINDELSSLEKGELKKIIDDIIKLSKRIKEYLDGVKR